MSSQKGQAGGNASSFNTPNSNNIVNNDVLNFTILNFIRQTGFDRHQTLQGLSQLDPQQWHHGAQIDPLGNELERVVGMLLEGNVDPSTTGNEYDERSHFLAAENEYEGVSVILDGLNLNTAEDDLAAENRYEEMLRILPELNDFNPNTAEDEGYGTPLFGCGEWVRGDVEDSARAERLQSQDRRRRIHRDTALFGCGEWV